jgi:hypothetical protein
MADSPLLDQAEVETNPAGGNVGWIRSPNGDLPELDVYGLC